jgi:hypothetical protein
MSEARSTRGRARYRHRAFRKTQGLMTRYLLLFDNYGLVFVGRPL